MLPTNFDNYETKPAGRVAHPKKYQAVLVNPSTAQQLPHCL
jgi:hypothetical protein